MRRISHGSTSPPSNNDDVLQDLGTLVEKYFFDTAKKQEKNPRFFHMFKGLADKKECLIPETAETLENLSELGRAMSDTDFDASFDSDLPSVYTYFAQFVNHDINFTDVKKNPGETDFEMLASKDLKPWTDQMISERVSNTRDGMLELDCVYGRMEADILPPRVKGNEDKMALGTVTPSENRPSGKEGDDHDLVRGPMSIDLRNDRPALIGDRRNDSNLIVSQLHVAFLKAHNKIVDRCQCTFEEAKQILRRHYHLIILNDFLPKIVPQAIIDAVKKAPDKDRLYHRDDGLPLEFSVAAFRFGHCMVRQTYYYNEKRSRMDLSSLFTLTALSNSVILPKANQGSPTLTADRIIQWEHFVGETVPINGATVPEQLHRNNARKLRTRMVDPLSKLINDDPEVNGERSLAVQDLKRGYMFRIPTGQEVAKRLGVQKPLGADDFKKISRAQFDALEKAKMLDCTPLSFYVLAEATENGMLGEVGGRIVAEVVIGLLRDHPDSIIGRDGKPDWTPEPKLGAKEGKFSLTDLLRLAGVLGRE